MVVDFHYHVVDRTGYHDNWWKGIAQSAVQILRSAGIEMNAGEIIDILCSLKFVIPQERN